MFSIMSNLQTHYHFKLNLQRVDQHILEAPNALMPISCKAWNSPAEYPSRECKRDIKESEGNMFNSIFIKNVQGRKHPGSCAFAEQNYLVTCVINTERYLETTQTVSRKMGRQ